MKWRIDYTFTIIPALMKALRKALIITATDLLHLHRMYYNTNKIIAICVYFPKLKTKDRTIEKKCNGYVS